MSLVLSGNRDDVNVSAAEGRLSITKSSAQLVSANGTSNLTARQTLFLVNESTVDMFLGFTSGVTATGSTKGLLLLSGGNITLPISDDVTLYAITKDSGQHELLVWELA